MTEKNVSFIHRGGPLMASYRYRASIPAAGLSAINGFKTYVNEGESSVYVFSKPVQEDVDLARRAKDQGAKVIADIGDIHFGHPHLGPIYRDMIALADRLVTPTPDAAAKIIEACGRVADAVIPDSYEQELQAPHANGDVLLWYGHRLNLKEIEPWFPHLKGRNLRIATGPTHDNPAWVKWGPEALKAEFAASNIVVLPTRKERTHNSANRLLNAIRAGCFVVCGDHPAYREFRKVAFVGNFLHGVRWADHFRDELDALVAEGQKYIEKYSPEAISRQWAQVLEAM